MKASPLALLPLIVAIVTFQPTAGATPEEVAAKGQSTIVPLFEIKDFLIADALEAASQATGIKVFHDQWASSNKLTLKLTKIPATELFRYITGLAGLKFRYESDGVHVVAQNAIFGPLK